MQKYLLIILFLLVCGALLFHRNENQQLTTQPQSLDHWENLIKTQGSQKAYEMLKQETQPLSYEEQHTLSHKFGSALYRVDRLKGVVVCDASFGYGCYHQFFLEAVGDQGPAVIAQLDQACIKQFGLGGQGCQHGIGHGLAEYFGHNLKEALKACFEMAWKKELFGCQSGVFMEYNTPTFIDENGTRRINRALNESDPYYPCPELERQFRPSCYLAQAEWWDRATDSSYSEMGEWCKGINEVIYKTICFKGLGMSIVPSEGFDPTKVLEACAQITEGKNNLFCRGGAFWAFWTQDLKEHAWKLTQDLSEDNKKQLMKEADLPNEGIVFQ